MVVLPHLSEATTAFGYKDNVIDGDSYIPWVISDAFFNEIKPA